MIEAITFIVSILLLVKGSDMLIDSASKLAKLFGVSDFIIGVTVVALGTSLPELASDTYASYIFKGDIVIGDIIGSNITNIALVLGIICIIKPLVVKHTEIYSGWLHLFILTAASFILLLGSGIGRITGLVFVLAYVAYLRKVIKEYETIGVEHVPRNSVINSIIKLAIGLTGVLIGAKLLVGTIISFAQTFGVPEYTISLILMAVGTSLPELSTAIVAAKKGYSTMALGNIIGSNVANILWVLGMSALVRPIHIDSLQILPAIVMMLLLSVLLIRFKRTQYTIDKKEGIIFLAAYLAFVLFSIATL
ncbi:MAG: calcium/sodium antiporter [Methanosarcinaceae archaeon]|nr:calcium/sodium antiporter [Methanosarcinaceae archaeon]